MNRSFQRLSGMMVAASAVLLVGGSVALALAQAGSASDPLVSKSYVEGTYQSNMTAKAVTAVQGKMDMAQTAVGQTLDSAQAQYTDQEIEDALAQQVAAALGSTAVRSNQTFTAGTGITASFGTELCILSGTAKLDSGTLVNLTTGKSVPPGSALLRNQLYLAAEQNAVIRATAPIKIRIQGDYQATSGSGSVYQAQYITYADALNDLGLFSGSNIGYELERAATRAEGLIMLLRLLGEEGQARDYRGSHPFRDVPAWADHYVAYAYQKGYTSGMSATEYGSQRKLTLNDYMTFLLRALKYSDTRGDFSWKTASDTAVAVGILTQAERAEILSKGIFYRDHIAYTSYRTLFLQEKGSQRRLCDRLLAQGVFTESQLAQAQENIG